MLSIPAAWNVKGVGGEGERMGERGMEGGEREREREREREEGR